MTALRKDVFDTVSATSETPAAMDLGEGVELFTTGLIRGGDMLLGGGVELFTTGLQRRDGALVQGAGTGLFTTGLGPQGA